MELARIKNSNMCFTAPAGDDDIVSNLYVRREDDLVFGVMLKSAWKPTEEELAVLLGGGDVILTIVGSAHPVVAIGVEP